MPPISKCDCCLLLSAVEAIWTRLVGDWKENFFFLNKGGKYLSLSKITSNYRCKVYKEREWKITSIFPRKAAFVLEEASEMFLTFAEHHFTLRTSCWHVDIFSNFKAFLWKLSIRSFKCHMQNVALRSTEPDGLKFVSIWESNTNIFHFFYSVYYNSVTII
jgi:hypothetical protein